MRQMGKMATLAVARILADLPTTQGWTTSKELAATLKVDKIEYKKLTGAYTVLNVNGQEVLATDFLQLYGDWDTVLLLLVAKAIKNGTYRWQRNNDLSALLGYSSNDISLGVFVHVGERVIEFQVKHQTGSLVESPMQFLNLYSLEVGD